ncbi:hypothetical protein C5167_031263, partial [Papaver somniferum]
MSRFVRHAYKSVASGLKYHTLHQRLLKSTDTYLALARVNKGGCTISSSHSLLIVFTKDELSKFPDDYLDSTCPKNIEEVVQVMEVGDEFGTTVNKLLHDYNHFKLHEEPNLTAINMLRGYGLPSAVAATLGFLVVEFKYWKQLKKEYLGKLSSFSIPGGIHFRLNDVPRSLLQQLKGNCQLKVPSSFKVNFCKLNRADKPLERDDGSMVSPSTKRKMCVLLNGFEVELNQNIMWPDGSHSCKSMLSGMQ